MAQSWVIWMLVHLESQKRPVIIAKNDDLNTLQHRIYQVFELPLVNGHYQYQAQFYDTEFGQHIDLCSVTWEKFLVLCRTLSTQSSPDKQHQEWHLKIINKAVSTVQENDTENSLVTNTSQATSVIDEIEYATSHEQGDQALQFTFDDAFNSPSFIKEMDNLLWLLNSEANNTPQSVLSFDTNNNEDTALQSGNDDKHDGAGEEAGIASQNPITNETVAVYEVPPDHDYNLRFDRNLAGSQRYQSEGEAISLKSRNPSVGGCLLEASEQNFNDPNDKIHPQIKFNIPEEMHDHSWTIREYVLTQDDANGNLYLHPSKEILNEKKLWQLVEANELQNINSHNENSVFTNPLEVKLSQDDLKRGAYEIRSRVFNLNSLSARKNKPLNLFQLKDKITGDLKLVVGENRAPGSSLFVLKMSHEKYHLGIILLLKGRIVANCVSSMTTERKRSRQKSMTIEGEVPSLKRKHDDDDDE